MDSETIYKATILDVVFKISRNHTPFIDLIAETDDDSKRKIDACYYFADRSKYFSYKELTKILNDFDIEVDEENILNSLVHLKGKEIYLIEMPKYENKYRISKYYKDINNNS